SESNSSSRLSLRQRTQRRPEDGVEVFPAGGLHGPLDRLFRQGALEAEVAQRRDHVLLHGRMRYYRLRRAEAFQLIAQFDAHTFGGLLADSRNSCEPGEVIAA